MAAARLRSPGSAPAPMWQDAQARRPSVYRILGSATSGPSTSVVCAMSRFPYSSVAATAVPVTPARGMRDPPRPQARVAATVITPIAPHKTRTVALPRVLWLMVYLVILLHICEKAVLGPLDPLAQSRGNGPGRHEDHGEPQRQQHDGIHDHWPAPWKNPRTKYAAADSSPSDN